jgi:phosphotransferase system enzyme I (PtsI)
MAAPLLTGERVLRGIPVSSGVTRGKVIVLGKRGQPIERVQLTDADVPSQIQRLEQALVQTRRQISDIQRRVAETMGDKDAQIFDAHLLLTEDPMLLGEITRLLEQEKVNAEYAVKAASDKYAAALSAVEDNYLRERVADLKDVTARLLDNLLGCQSEEQLHLLDEPCIVVAHDLSPSTTALLDKKKVLGFATDVGSQTSHTAILARSLQIPAVVGLGSASHELATGQHVLLDGVNGLLVINPTDKTLFEYGQLVRHQVSLREKLLALRDLPAVLLDGTRVLLSANIATTDDVEAVKASGAEGAGLFRTEFLFLHRSTVPSEEEQYQAYRTVAEALKPQPVVIRTLDLGGDKFLTHVSVTPETSSFYGWRAIRFCLHEKEMFRVQLRAILRASAAGNVKLMFPMISGLNELLQARELVEQCKEELRTEGKPFDDAMEIGAMIEVPSAVLVADSLAKHCKFFSIGTNDLIQYSLAVNRNNEKVAYLYEPTHPAVLRLIKMTIDAGHRHGLWVGVCGEMAGDPALAAILLGLGVDELSAAPAQVPAVKYLIRRLRLDEARNLADFALQSESGAEILSKAQALVQKVAPSLVENDGLENDSQPLDKPALA